MHRPNARLLDRTVDRALGCTIDRGLRNQLLEGSIARPILSAIAPSIVLCIDRPNVGDEVFSQANAGIPTLPCEVFQLSTAFRRLVGEQVERSRCLEIT